MPRTGIGSDLSKRLSLSDLRGAAPFVQPVPSPDLRRCPDRGRGATPEALPLSTAGRDAVLFELLVEGASRNAQATGGEVDLPVQFIEHVLNVAALNFLQGHPRASAWR